MVRRGVRGSVEDRWVKKVRNPDGTITEVPSAKHGIRLRWRARYVDAEATEREKNFDVKREAEAWLRARLAEVDAGTHIDPAKGKATVGDVHRAWSASQGHLAKSTAGIRAYTWGKHVEPKWGKTPIAEVRTSAVRSWVAAMVNDGRKAATIENAVGILRMVLGAAVEDGRLARNPATGVKLPKRKHADRGYLTHAQVRALAGTVARDGVLVRFLCYTGLRWGEMAALRVQDFDMLRRRVRITRNVVETDSGLDWRNPKPHEKRTVPFPASLADELAALMVGKKRADLVFTDTRGNVIRNSNWVTRVCAPAVARCQEADGAFPHVTPHDFRHTAASLAVSAGAHVKAVQRMLGHASAAMTLDTYADLFDSDLDDVAVSLDATIRADEQAERESPAGPLRDETGSEAE